MVQMCLVSWRVSFSGWFGSSGRTTSTSDGASGVFSSFTWGGVLIGVLHEGISLGLLRTSLRRDLIPSFGLKLFWFASVAMGLYSSPPAIPWCREFLLSVLEKSKGSARISGSSWGKWGPLDGSVGFKLFLKPSLGLRASQFSWYMLSFDSEKERLLLKWPM